MKAIAKDLGRQRGVGRGAVARSQCVSPRFFISWDHKVAFPPQNICDENAVQFELHFTRKNLSKTESVNCVYLHFCGHIRCWFYWPPGTRSSDFIAHAFQFEHAWKPSTSHVICSCAGPSWLVHSTPFCPSKHDDTFDAAVVDAVTAGVDMLIVSHSRAWQKKAMEVLPPDWQILFWSLKRKSVQITAFSHLTGKEFIILSLDIQNI